MALGPEDQSDQQCIEKKGIFIQASVQVSGPLD